MKYNPCDNCPRDYDRDPEIELDCSGCLYNDLEDQGAPPYPAHANSRGCEKYEEKETCGTCSKFTPKHAGNGGVVYGMCPLGLLGKNTTSQMAGCSDWIEKHSTRLTAESVDSGSKDSAPVDGDGERS
jgi:hypothetical protein